MRDFAWWLVGVACACPLVLLAHTQGEARGKMLAFRMRRDARLKILLGDLQGGHRQPSELANVPVHMLENGDPLLLTPFPLWAGASLWACIVVPGRDQ